MAGTERTAAAGGVRWWERLVTHLLNGAAFAAGAVAVLVVWSWALGLCAG